MFKEGDRAMNKPEHIEPPSEYFAFAAKLAKAQAAAVLATLAKDEAIEAAHKLAAKELAEADARYAETYRKMIESFKKDAKRRREQSESVFCEDAKTQQQVDAEMLRDFDAVEAMAINAGRY